MASEKQIAANKRNSLRSTGPRTETGKARSRMSTMRYRNDALGSAAARRRLLSPLPYTAGSSTKPRTLASQIDLNAFPKPFSRFGEIVRKQDGS